MMDDAEKERQLEERYGKADMSGYASYKWDD